MTWGGQRDRIVFFALFAWEGCGRSGSAYGLCLQKPGPLSSRTLCQRKGPRKRAVGRAACAFADFERQRLRLVRSCLKTRAYPNRAAPGPGARIGGDKPISSAPMWVDRRPLAVLGWEEDVSVLCVFVCTCVLCCCGVCCVRARACSRVVWCSVCWKGGEALNSRPRARLGPQTAAGSSRRPPQALLPVLACAWSRRLCNPSRRRQRGLYVRGVGGCHRLVVVRVLSLFCCAARAHNACGQERLLPTRRVHVLRSFTGTRFLCLC